MAEHPNTTMAKECKVKLKSKDDKIFEVEYAVAMQSQTLKNALAQTGCTDTTLPLHDISSQILAKVIEYCEYHVNAANTTSEKDVKMWDEELVKHMDQDTLFRLIVAAKYLEIHNLVDLMCKTIADRIKDKSVEELREIFHVQNDFTPEEEEQVRHETKWAHGE
ncbi:SKP1-like protein 1A [Cryptomeria japonica]|uniref:SKP1-like protein 1A n=1 Tax=Cryptomeria japonica TaxID=3369 RepID=UPI0025ABCAB9|nr:SKP1-like protein 1A [Cryptomeria japonica]